MSRIAVVIHLASLIALVLKFEPEGDLHGCRMSLNPDQGVSVPAEGKKGWAEK